MPPQRGSARPNLEIYRAALDRRLAYEQELRSPLDRNSHKRGNARLRRVLNLPGGPRRTRSPTERAMLRLMRKSGVAE